MISVYLLLDSFMEYSLEFVGMGRYFFSFYFVFPPKSSIFARNKGLCQGGRR